MKTLNALLIIMIMTLQTAAQDLAGTVVDEKKEPLLSATVMVFQD